MAISLYDATAPTFRQLLGGVAHFLDRGEAHFADQGTPLQEIVEARLFPDMLPLNFQVLMTEVHSIGAIDAVKKGTFSPPIDRTPPADYAACKKMVADALARLDALSADEVNSLEGRDMFFEFGGRKLPFTAETFLFSFSQPNFHFHAATAYDILRMKGAPLGKRDYVGALQLKMG